MFNASADLFFTCPRNSPMEPGWFSVLYLLRRDISQCMGIDPDSGEPANYKALWPGAMAILAGIDLLAKFHAGSDKNGEVRKRFIAFIYEFLPKVKPQERDVVYQLRNALLHSFGLYSREDRKGAVKVYRFFLTYGLTTKLISYTSPDNYHIDLKELHVEFEDGIEEYRRKLDGSSQLEAKFHSDVSPVRASLHWTRPNIA